MNQATWTDVDAYIGDRLLSRDAARYEAILAANAAAGLPAIDVSPLQGKFLNLLVQISGARRILELGTLGGYSTIWMASAQPAGGILISLEYSAHHAEIAQRNIAAAGLTDTVEIRIGAALDLLPGLEKEGVSFDFVFIDADKANNSAYLDWALKLSRPGATIILDNVVRDGTVIDAKSGAPGVTGSRAAFDYLKAHPQIDATALQTVGLKGYDGFIMGVVQAKAEPR